MEKFMGYQVNDDLDLNEENRLLRGIIRSITERINMELCTPAFGEHEEGFNNGVKTCLSIIEEETKLKIEDILQPRCKIND